jgi:hypothetical protein
MAIGNKMSPAMPGTIPENISLYPFAPQLEVLHDAVHLLRMDAQIALLKLYIMECR